MTFLVADNRLLPVQCHCPGGAALANGPLTFSQPKPKNPFYTLLFDDDDEKKRKIAIDHVLPLPHGYIE
jgi:hypothetical protein